MKMASDILSLFCETTAPHLIKCEKGKIGEWTNSVGLDLSSGK